MFPRFTAYDESDRNLETQCLTLHFWDLFYSELLVNLFQVSKFYGDIL